MKTYKGYQFKSAVAELITKIAKDVKRKVRINWEASISTAGINQRGDLYLADVADDAVLTHADLVKYVGFGVHEILHAKHTDFRVNAPDHDQYLRTLHNAIEDAYIEREGIRTLMTGNIGNLLGTLADTMVAKAKVEVTDWSNPAQYPFALAIYLRDHAATKTPLANGLEPIFAEAKARLVNCFNTEDTLRLAVWVKDQLDSLPEDTQETPPDNPVDGPTRPDQDGDEGEGADDGDKASEDGDGVGPAKRPDQYCKAREVEPENEAPKGKAGAGCYSEDANITLPQRHLDDVWMSKDAPVPARLRYEVKRLFDNSGINEFQRNRKSGSVNVHALPSAGFNDKVFKRRHDVDGIDTCVAVVLDVSGSMFCDGGYDRTTGKAKRITTAVQACIALLETLQKAQVATCLLTFGGSVAVQKPFEMSTAKAIQALRGVSDGGNTNDYFAVRYAHKLLLNRPEQRKICFVLTDGDGHRQHCHEQVLVGERLGVTTIGLGIQHDVAHVYPQNASVSDLSELGSVSFKQIKLAA